jgi:CcmD family protein
MTVHPVSASDAPPTRPHQQRPDSAAYDSAWAQTEMPAAEPYGLETYMTADGKVYVVLAVVLIIWLGLLLLLFRTDRKIDRLERRLDEDGSHGD